jgi:hypothetical protein
VVPARLVELRAVVPRRARPKLRTYTHPKDYAYKVDKRHGTLKEQMRVEYLARRG